MSLSTARQTASGGNEAVIILPSATQAVFVITVLKFLSIRKSIIHFIHPEILEYEMNNTLPKKN
jgi:hypothetical protein